MEDKLLIIENQRYQYKAIAGFLTVKETKYRIFPTETEYDSFTDWVRVVVSDRYSEEKSALCFKKIVDYIMKNNIDLILMDFKLAGNDDGINGVALASKLIIEFNHLCFIFLTQTQENSREVKDELSSVDPRLAKKYIWAYKGYAGLNLFAESYFTHHVKPKIQELIGESRNAKFNMLIERLNEIKRDPLWQDDYTIIDQLISEVKTQEFVNDRQRKFITDLENILVNPTDFDKDKIHDTLIKFKNGK